MLINELSFQLYSARNTALPEALAIIANAGYKSVEAYGGNFQQLDAFTQELNAAGLTVSSVHISRDELKNNMVSSIELAATLGADHIVCPYLQPDDRPKDKNGWMELAEELADINAQISATGRDFAWHNHDFEFHALPDGSLPMRLLLDNVPDLHWEIDIGWIQRASQDPASWLRTYLDRVSAVHLKDVATEGSCTDEDGWADVGHGNVDWAEVLTELLRCEADLFIVEHDNPSDLKRFAERSFKTVSSWS